MNSCVQVIHNSSFRIPLHLKLNISSLQHGLNVLQYQNIKYALVLCEMIGIIHIKVLIIKKNV